MRVNFTPDTLDLRAEDLHHREQEALLALGEAELAGLPGDAARAELRKVRESLTAIHAASRVLEIRGGLR